MPEGFALPENAEPGKPFEVLATLKQDDSGMLVLLELDGTPVSSKDADEMSDAAPQPPAGGKGGFLDAIEAKMAGG